MCTKGKGEIVVTWLWVTFALGGNRGKESSGDCEKKGEKEAVWVIVYPCTEKKRGAVFACLLSAFVMGAEERGCWEL